MRRVVILAGELQRRTAARYLVEQPLGNVVIFTEQTRNLEQNAKFHAICSDLAKGKLPWAGKPRSAAAWKVLLVSGHAIATKEGADVIPGLESEFVNVRESTALMNKARGSSLIEYSIAFCVKNDVVLHEAA